MKKLFILLLITLISCQQLKPDTVRIPEYPDYAELMKDQVLLLGNRKIRKRVVLEGISEMQDLTMDSARWAKELAFLKEINPNQPEYVGAFEKSGDEINQILTLAAGENGALKMTSFSKSNAGFDQIYAVFHEDKDVYIHHKEMELSFVDGLLNNIQIDGYQKMMFKDTIRFRIEVEVD